MLLVRAAYALLSHQLFFNLLKTSLTFSNASFQIMFHQLCQLVFKVFSFFGGVLAELLRKSAEHTLVDMVQLLFSR